ncbi:taste receptor type 2 member 40-like [Leptodactylus fuscus]|uniref:taste receptor type 2 member 40-like n=1 Tax=Leptodactylus fuscus TaxID=238119 RepID=UPI003F4E553A
MDSTTDKVFLVILLLETIAGLFSSFSVIACLLKQFKRNNLTTYSKILIPLNMSNIFYTSVLSVNFILADFFVEVVINDFVYYTTMFITLYSITSSLWLSGGLCVFYFIKIMPSQPGILTTLKSWIGAVVWWFVVIAEVVALGGSFFSLLISNTQKNQRNSTSFQSVLMEEMKVQSTRFTNTILILNILPFLVIMMTTIGSAWFLKLYNCQIQKNLTTPGNTSVRDYESAIQTMIGLLVLYGSVFVCIIIFALNILPYKSLGYWICGMFLFSFPTVLSTLLFYKNPKLKESFKQMFIVYIKPQDSS